MKYEDKNKISDKIRNIQNGMIDIDNFLSFLVLNSH